MCKPGTIIRLDNMKHVAVQTICVVIDIMSSKGSPRSGFSCASTPYLSTTIRADNPPQYASHALPTGFDVTQRSVALTHCDSLDESIPRSPIIGRADTVQIHRREPAKFQNLARRGRYGVKSPVQSQFSCERIGSTTTCGSRHPRPDRQIFFRWVVLCTRVRAAGLLGRRCCSGYVFAEVSILVEMNSVTLACLSISRTMNGTCDRCSSTHSFGSTSR
jgi:hypothetical protein